MGVKTAGVGHFQIPTAPAAGTSVTSGDFALFALASFTKQEALRVRESYVPLIEIQRVAFHV